MELPNFISEHLSVIMSMKNFEVISEDIKERIQHLSYLMFLIGQQEDFQCFYSGYQTIQQYLKGNNVDVDHEDYHKMVEKLLSERFEAVWIILSWNKFNPSWSRFVLSWYKFIPTWYKFMPGSRQKILDFQIKLFTKNSKIVFSSGFQKLIVVGFET